MITGQCKNFFCNILAAAFSVRGFAFWFWLLTGVSTIVAPSVFALKSSYGELIRNADFGGALAVFLWLIFATASLAFLIPGALPLTIVRVVVPANSTGSLLIFLGVDSERAATSYTLNFAFGLIATVLVLLPAFADAVVNAGSYGDERRYLLRAPGPVLIAAVVPMWILSVVGLTAGPLLLVNQHWATGIAATLAGIILSLLAWFSLYRLGCRWLVFTPRSLVIHDYMITAQPIPLSRRSISSVRPAQVNTSAVDLTKQAFGLALEIRLKEPVTVAITTRRGKSKEQAIPAILISPSRPAHVMNTAKKRGIKIG